MEDTPFSKPHLNLSLIGASVSGKSTTAGHLVYKLGGIETWFLHSLEQLSETEGKLTHKFAWVMDTLTVERQVGYTVSMCIKKLETRRRHFSLIDSPGNERYGHNAIRAISEADATLLVVSAVPGEFEAGIEKYGQTKGSIELALTFGVKQFVCCVNKMDDSRVSWSQPRFEEIVEKVGKIFTWFGFDARKVHFVPISGWTGDNLVERAAITWHSECLLEVLDRLEPPRRHPEKPLRMPVSNVLEVVGLGTVIVGKVEAGVISPGMQVTLTPGGIKSTVQSITVNHEELSQAGPGDHAEVALDLSVLASQIIRGMVLSDQSTASRPIRKFTAMIVVLHHPSGIKVGYKPVVFCHTARSACCIERIIGKVDRKTKAITESDPQCVLTGEWALCVLRPLLAISLEVFEECPPLGRFVIRDNNKNVAVGIVKAIERAESWGVMKKNKAREFFETK